jgi:alkylation response protein AidB-like acyl-CoA dehydrogenase
MQFKLDAEQQLLQDSVRRFVDRAYSFEARTALLREGRRTAHWPVLADNGWLAASLPEAYGGLDGSALETALIAGELGRGLVVEPFLGCAVLAAQTFLAAAGPAHKDEWLSAMADGSCRMALAYAEPEGRGNPQVVGLRAERTAEGYTLSGRKTLVIGAVGADCYLVSARTDGAVNDASGISLFLVEPGTPGLGVHRLPLHDGSEAAELVFKGVHVEDAALVGSIGAGLPALRHGLSHAIVALCAELVGAMEKAIELTAEYLKVRQQFGVAIGSFQALQHRMADMAGELELSRSMLYALLASLENDAPGETHLAVSQAKSLVGRMARSVCGQAIQLHGGIGMTEECAVGHYFKRAVVADVLFGTSDQHDMACTQALQA